MEQFKNEASRAKVAPRSILRIVNVRIDENAVGGCLRFRLMVVDDDYVDAKFTKVSNRLVSISATIESDKKLRDLTTNCLLYTSPSPRDVEESRMPSSA